MFCLLSLASTRTKVMRHSYDHTLNAPRSALGGASAINRRFSTP